jgi:hypothetical protein
MKKIVLLAGILGLFSVTASAQCTNVTLNWDYLDFFPYNVDYDNTSGYLASNAFSRTQKFSFGRQNLQVTHNFADAASLGENGTHTGEAGSFGTGDDLAFSGNGTITLTFDDNVTNLQFSVYDLDQSQSLSISAANAASVPQAITVAKANASGTHVIVGSGTIAASVTTTSNDRTNSSDLGTINITVAGPVRTITLSFGGTAGTFWISDIRACTDASFPTNYFAVSQPFTGMPAYVLHSFDKSVYAVNPATGVTKLLFTDPTSLGGSTFINSMAYDPYNRILYYVYSLTTNPGNNRQLKKYDFNTKTISTVLSDISSTTAGVGLGIPVVRHTGGNAARGTGVESGAAAFYDGNLYLGIETSAKDASGPTGDSNREAVIWKIEFDGSGVPISASQAWAIPVDNGTSLSHDWSDFLVNDGVLYDFDGAGVTTQTNIYHTNLTTGATTNYPLPSGFTPGQPAMNWAGQIFQLHAQTASPVTSPYIAPYNMNGTIGTRTNLTSSPMFTPAIPSLGDAAEAYRPLVDFGDAPTSYDPVATSPAIHEEDANLHLGTSMDIEWLTRGQSALANNDNFDNGLAFVTTFSPTQDQYLIQVNVYNNTGANATLIGWLDYNGNGVFDAAEGRSVTVPSSASPQNVYVYWSGALGSTLPNASYTYLRLRITSAANGMTTSNPTGYFANGEVEDYRVYVNTYPLQTTLLTFDAQRTQAKKVELTWTTAAEKPGVRYELERSGDGTTWTVINRQAGNTQDQYRFTDAQPLAVDYYRLRMIAADGSVSLSEIRKIVLQEEVDLTTYPNPARDLLNVRFNSDLSTTAEVRLLDISGRVVYRTNMNIRSGQNLFAVPMDRKWPEGTYMLVFSTPERVSTRQVMFKKP